MKSHMLTKKSAKRKRSFRQDRPVAPSDVKDVRQMLGAVSGAGKPGAARRRRAAERSPGGKR
jgi:hypothetical protein